MKYDPNKYHRRSLRLPGYDYTQVGAYFVTVCTHSRRYMFGDVIDGEMRLNDPGGMVEQWWVELEKKFPLVKIDKYMVMPDHFHGIVIIVDQHNHVGADAQVCPIPQGADPGAPLPRVLQWFKTMTTNGYICGVKQLSWAPLQGKLWQCNYYEHIIRNERELDDIRQYIVDNPAKWHEDVGNPQNFPA
jgi:putative transposase